MRMNILESPFLDIYKQCIGCHVCEKLCPQKCISFTDKKAFSVYPTVNYDKCTQCGYCIHVCPIVNLEKNVNPVKGYYGWCRDTALRKNSSSGGIFGIIATQILKEGGVVFGAVFDQEQKTVLHTSTDRVPLKRLLKSKYVESDISKSYSLVLENLKKKRKVLFCGTPCQIHGLNNFLREFKNSKDLFTCDFVCHGVPSSQLFNMYLSEIEKKYKSNVIDVDFRPKTWGWNQHAIKINFNNGMTYLKPAILDEFFSGSMIDNVLLRENCYHCQFIKRHIADLTLADFWGIQNYAPEKNDNSGISLIICNNDKAISIVQKISSYVEIYDLDKANYNYVYADKTYPESIVEKRDEIFKQILKKNQFLKVAHRTYFKNRFFNRINGLLKEY